MESSDKRSKAQQDLQDKTGQVQEDQGQHDQFGQKYLIALPGRLTPCQDFPSTPAGSIESNTRTAEAKEVGDCRYRVQSDQNEGVHEHKPQ